MQSKIVKLIHETFEVGIVLKGINAVLEMIGAVLLLFIHPATINRLVATITQGELSEDPKDKIANFLVNTAHGISITGEFYGALFLLAHGIIKLFLIVAMFKRKLWAYPISLGIFGLFFLYQSYRYVLSDSVWMIVLNVLDIFVIILTYLEYYDLKTQQI